MGQTWTPAGGFGTVLPLASLTIKTDPRSIFGALVFASGFSSGASGFFFGAMDTP